MQIVDAIFVSLIKETLKNSQTFHTLAMAVQIGYNLSICFSSTTKTGSNQTFPLFQAHNFDLKISKIFLQKKQTFGNCAIYSSNGFFKCSISEKSSTSTTSFNNLSGVRSITLCTVLNKTDQASL